MRKANYTSKDLSGYVTINPNANRTYLSAISTDGDLRIQVNAGSGVITVPEGVLWEPIITPIGRVIMESDAYVVIATESPKAVAGPEANTVLTVRTTAPAETFTLPFRDGFEYFCTVDWGDGTTDTIEIWNDAALTHEYAIAGDYDVTIRGLAESLYFWNTGAAQTQLIDVKQWGKTGWTACDYMFHNCGNCVFTAGPICDTSAVTTFSSMFWHCFAGNPDVSGFNTVSATNLGSFLQGCTLATPNMAGFITNNITNMGYMLEGCSIADVDISKFNISSLTNATDMMLNSAFSDANFDKFLLAAAAQEPSILNNVSFHAGSAQFTEVSSKVVLAGTHSWNFTDGGIVPTTDSTILTVQTTGSLETFQLPFRTGYAYNCIVDWGDGRESGITAWDDAELLHTYIAAGDYDVTISGLAETLFFNYGSQRLKLIDIKQWGQTGWTSAFRMFYGCSNLTAISAGPICDTRLVTTMQDMFGEAELTSIDITGFDTSLVEDMSGMFYWCLLLDIDISHFNIGALTTATNMLRDTAFSDANYDKFLLAAAAQEPNILDNVAFHAGTAKYTAIAARAVLGDDTGSIGHLWVITDDGIGAVVNNPATGAPDIYPQIAYEVGNLVFAVQGSVDDLDGMTTSVLSFQWYSEATPVGADNFIYTLEASDEGNRIRCEVTFNDDLGNPEGPLTSAWSVAVTAPGGTIYAKFTDVGRSGHTDYQVTETTDGSSYWPLDIYPTTGKHYCEFTQDASSNDNPWLGVAGSSSTTIYLGNHSSHVGLAPITGLVRNGGSDVATISSASVSDGTVFGILYDADAQTVEWFVNGVSLGSHTTTIAGASLTAGWGQGSTNSTYTISLNAGPGAFAHPENIPVGCSLGWGTNVPLKEAPAGYSHEFNADLGGFTFNRASEQTAIAEDGIIYTSVDDEPVYPGCANDGAGNWTPDAGFKGLLLEGERTNEFLYSEDFSSAISTSSSPWRKVDETTVTLEAAAVGPDGNTGSVYRHNTLDTFVGGVYQDVAASSNDGTISCFMRSGGVGRDQFRLRYGHFSNGLGPIETALSTWAVFNTSQSGQTSSLAGTRIDATEDSNYLATMWQAEHAPFASSYIKTTGAPVTRAATTCSQTLANMGLPDLTNDFTVQIVFELMADRDDYRDTVNSAICYLVGADPSSNYLRIDLGKTNSNLRVQKKYGGIVGAYVQENISTVSRGDLIELDIIVSSVDGVEVYLGGSLVSSDAAETDNFIAPLTECHLGSSDSNSNNHFMIIKSFSLEQGSHPPV